MKTLALVILVVAFSHLAVAAVPVEGTYTQQWWFLDHSDNDARVEGTDDLKIKNIEPLSFQFEVEVTGANAHRCALEGTAKLIGKVFEYREQLDAPTTEAQEDQCRLQFDFQDSQVRLIDDFSCKKYCGSRAAFNGKIFQAPTKKTANPTLKRDALKRAP